MADRSEDQAVAPDGDSQFLKLKPDAEKLLAEVDELLPRAKPVIGGTDFGADALKKAEATIARTRNALTQKNGAELGDSLKPLERTLSLLKNVIQKLGT